MSEHPVSQFYVSKVLPSWERNNYEVELFEAVTPLDLPKFDELGFQYLTYKDHSFRRDFTETERAVWYSHYLLWEKCVRNERPMVIIEHDSRLLRHIPVDLKGPKFLSFVNDTWTVHRKASNGDPGDDATRRYLAPGSGYWLTPKVAEAMILTALNMDINLQVDGFLRRFIPVHEKSDVYFIEQINIDGLNTIDHKKNYRKFVPL